MTGARVEGLRGTARAREVAALHALAFARPWSEAEMVAVLSQPATRAHGLILGPELAGFIASSLVGDEAEVLTLAVAADARGRGHAHALLDAHLVELAAEGARLVHLEVNEGNAPALALYRRAGFVETGRRPGYYASAGVTPAAAMRMTLALAPLTEDGQRRPASFVRRAPVPTTRP